MPATRATQEVFQQLFHDAQAEVRKLVGEAARKDIEIERLRAEVAELKRKSRRKRK
jgi:hypothetical protein